MPKNSGPFGLRDEPERAVGGPDRRFIVQMNRSISHAIASLSMNPPFLPGSAGADNRRRSPNQVDQPRDKIVLHDAFSLRFHASAFSRRSPP